MKLGVPKYSKYHVDTTSEERSFTSVKVETNRKEYPHNALNNEQREGYLFSVLKVKADIMLDNSHVVEPCL